MTAAKCHFFAGIDSIDFSETFASFKFGRTVLFEKVKTKRTFDCNVAMLHYSGNAVSVKSNLASSN